MVDLMLLIEYREHDDNKQYRVWTKEDAEYGSFKVLTLLELQIVIRACTLMGGLCRPAEDAHIDPINMERFLPWMLDIENAKRENKGST